MLGGRREVEAEHHEEEDVGYYTFECIEYVLSGQQIVVFSTKESASIPVTAPL